MRKILTLLALAIAITTSLGIAAMENKDKDKDKLTGTIKSVDAKKLVLQLETADKKIVSFSVTGNTRIARGEAAATLQEITTGTRVVVALEPGKTPPVATEIQLISTPAKPADHH